MPDGLRLSFDNSRGLRLAGDLLLPATLGPHPVVVFAHDWGSSKADPVDREVATALRTAGIAVLLFDFTGHGDSEGTDEDATEQQCRDDLASAVALLNAFGDVDPGRLGVVGVGAGAAVTLQLAADAPKISAVTLRPGHVTGLGKLASLVRVPTLLVVGERDPAIRAANEALFVALGGDRWLEVIPGGDHRFADRAARDAATARIVAWFAARLA
jgi:putative phosphoribosyl transferase